MKQALALGGRVRKQFLQKERDTGTVTQGLGSRKKRGEREGYK